MLVDILDSATLQKLQALKIERGFRNSGSALAFSPDSRMLTHSGHHDHPSERKVFVVTWDLQTGGVISAIERPVDNYYPGKAYITYSTNGKTVGVLHWYLNATTISIYNVASGIYSHDVYHAPDRIPTTNLRQPGYNFPWYTIWTHGESLRFVTAAPTAVITWEVGFDPGATLTEIGSLSFPESHKPTVLTPDLKVEVHFHPASHRLALFRRKTLGELLVWDVQESKSLLHSTDTSFYPRMTFSSDGRFFACPTDEFQVYLWKESSTGYVLHGILTRGTPDITPFLSPNGELLFTHDGSVTQLWHTKGFTPTPSGALPQARRIENFVLDFLPGSSLAAVARRKDDTVAVLDLESGIPRWTIDAGMEVDGLRVIGETVAVIGGEKVTAWNLPGGILFSGDRMGVEDSVRTIRFGRVGSSVIAASVSFDFGYIAVLCGERLPLLKICNTSSGKNIFSAPITGRTLWFLPDGRSVGLVSDGNQREVVKITTQDTLEQSKPLGDIENGQWGCPHESSGGYKVTNDGWIISPSGKRLLMLPPHWRSGTARRVWNGKFLGLLHGTLPEAVILELGPPPEAF